MLANSGWMFHHDSADRTLSNRVQIVVQGSVGGVVRTGHTGTMAPGRGSRRV